MTAMPQMVALFNGVGGGAAALIAISEYHDRIGLASDPATSFLISTLFSAIVGGVSFAGSMIAFGKLQEVISGSPVTVPGQKAVNAVNFTAIVVLAVYLAAGNESEGVLVLAVALSLLLGVSLVMAIGGADMPVVISLLNSFTGLAAAATGFVLHNNVLIIAGTLVGASGALLTQMMSQAMNRSLANVVFGAFGTGRRRRGGRPGGRPGTVRSALGRRCRGDARLRPPRRDRARLRPGRRPGAAQRPRAGRPARAQAASTCATPSIRSPAACRGT